MNGKDSTNNVPLTRDYDKHKSVAIDLDGTLIEYHGWVGPTHFGATLPGAIAALSKLQAEGWRIIIHTARRDVDLVAEHIQRAGIPCDELRAGKPGALYYIDDRALRYEGNWPDMLDSMDVPMTIAERRMIAGGQE